MNIDIPREEKKMKKKILYIENVATIEAISFYKAALEAAHMLGWEFHLAYNCLDFSGEKIEALQKKMGLTFHQIDFIRNPIHPGNIKAYHQLCELFDREHFDIVHCNTPVGGVLGRGVAKRKKVGRVIYQAHGFHFYKGAPTINWLVYYPIEKALAKITDVIITINKDDYTFAHTHFRPRSKVDYVPGVGIDLGQWKKTDRKNVREELGFSGKDFVILVVGRLEKNKNCMTIIEAVNKLHDNYVKIAFCGDGEERELLQKKTEEYGLQDNVFFLGNISDMNELYHMADCFVLASFREGLSRSIMEAMACGLPCVVSDIRGNRDLVDEKGGILFNPTRVDELADGITKVYKSRDLRDKMTIHNEMKINQFSLKNVVDSLKTIYKDQFKTA